MSRRISMVVHRGTRPGVRANAFYFAKLLHDAGIEVDRTETVEGARGAELLVVMGGDGTMLRGAEIAREVDAPILGINYGHMGFLSEAEPEELTAVAESVVRRRWDVEQRMTLDISVTLPDGTKVTNWALNEVTIEKDAASRLIGLNLSIDHRAVSAFRADAAILSTPTGSTAYNFSAGGPIVWPDVQAMIVTPVSAHALFTRPLVVSPSSVASVDVTAESGVIRCDGRRDVAAPAGTQVDATRGKISVKLARLKDAPFSGRLVTKFQLPVKSWRNENGDAS